MHALPNVKCSQNLQADHNRSARPLEETADATFFFSSSRQAPLPYFGSGTLSVFKFLGAIVTLWQAI